MPASGEIAQLIRGLCASDTVDRQRAATKIFESGSRLALAVLGDWLADPELSAQIVRVRSGLPEITVGVAVQPETFELIRSTNGSPRLADVPPDQDAREFELDYPEDVRLDVLTTREPGGSGAIARFLKRSSEGIQQVEIQVGSADRATELVRRLSKIEPVYPATRPGANGTRVNFFLVPIEAGKKVLIELVETGDARL